MTADTSTTDAPADTSSEDTQPNLSIADLVSAGQQNSDKQSSNTPSTGDGNSAPLFAPDEATEFRDRWAQIQAAFVDDPRQAVQQADGLVAQTIQRLAAVFADERSTLENQWSAGENVSTEDLRLALQRYRSFFDRLLSV